MISKDLTDKIPTEKYYVIFAGARVPLRQWPAEKFADTANYIHQQTGWLGILVGSKDEFETCQKIADQSAARLENFAGKTSLLEMIQLIGSAKLFVGNETSGIHIAIAQKVPSVCLLGGGHFGRFMPYPASVLETNHVISEAAIHPMPCFNCDWNCIYKTGKDEVVPCVEKIELETVKRKIDLILSKANLL